MIVYILWYILCLSTCNARQNRQNIGEAEVRFHQVIAVTWLALTCVLAPANAEKRIALVIGNAAYRHADRLANPVNDAQGMRDALKGLGFDVIYGVDLDLKALRRAIGQFADRVEGADVAIVYFAGHGVTFGDTPYVVPVDAEFSSLGQVAYELVPVETLIGELRQVKGVRIAILDACRDNGAEQELKRQSTRGVAMTRGLAPMKNPGGLIIAYATQYLSTAADDAGGAGLSSHSPFTTALLNNIATPGLDVKDLFYKVGRDVIGVTGGKQRPEISISMYEQYALAPATAGPAANPPVATPPVASAPVSDAERTWGIIQGTKSIAVLDDFIRQFGAMPIYGALALARREELAKELAREPAGGPARPAAGQQTAAVAPPVTPAVPAADPCAGAVTASFPSRCAAPLTAAQERGLKPKDSFRECDNCPEMMVVAAGSFTMGSPQSEPDRESDEGPQHVVTIGRPFAAGKLHVTIDQFTTFVRETRYDAGARCSIYSGKLGGEKGSWRNPGFAQEGSHPVVCMSWTDAKAYVDWLAKKTGRPYRLLSEAEWEYAARGRTSPGVYPRFWFGEEEKELCRYANGRDRNLRGGNTCSGGESTAPAGQYEPNAFGLYDVSGNANQWTADCWHDNYNGAPADGSAWTTGPCRNGRVVRGGSWNLMPWFLRVASRTKYTDTYADYTVGFRVARTLTP
jgi:formylglycine-generating enzyme required for sulfatase activity